MSLFVLVFHTRKVLVLFLQTAKKEQNKESMSREKYEQKRKMTGRGFRKEWLSEFIWLDYNEKEDRCIAKCAETFLI